MAAIVNPLATPKGVKLLCELCQRPAHVQCTACRVTYYCGPEHQRDDWAALHEKVCEIVKQLRSAPLSHATSSEERRHRQQLQVERREHISEVALQEGRRFLHEGRPELAIPAGLGALRFLTELHGEAALKLTPAYLILAEATINTGRLSEADQYLSQAQWSVLKNPGTDPGLRSRLERNLGQLAAAKNCFAQARKHFAEDIYYSSIAYGCDALETSGGYYHLGRVFLCENKPHVALSLHDQVISIWQSHLSSLVGDGKQSSTLGSAERAEAVKMLHSIRQLRERHTTSSPQLMTTIYHSLALLHTVLADHAKAELYAQKALELASQWEQGASTVAAMQQLVAASQQQKGTIDTIH